MLLEMHIFVCTWKG